MSELSQLEAAVLAALKEMTTGSRVEFDMQRLVELTTRKLGGTANLSNKALEEALLSLENKGYLRIVKVPPDSEVVREHLRGLLRRLDASFISGQLHPQEYLIRFDEIRSKCPSLNAKPLPPAGFNDLLKAILSVLQALEKLSKLAGTVTREAFDTLRAQYTEKLISLVSEANEILDIVQEAVNEVSENMRKIKLALEVIKLDEEVSGVTKRAERRELEKQLSVYAEMLKAILNWLHSSRAAEVEAKIKQLKARIEQLQAQREIIWARLQIEQRKELAEQLKKIEEEISAIKSELDKMQTEQGDLNAVIMSLSDELHNKGVLPEDAYVHIKNLNMRVKEIEITINRALNRT